MIKFNIHPKIHGGRGANLRKFWKNVKVIEFFLTFSGTFSNKIKNNLGQECVKGGLLSFQRTIGTIAPDFPKK